MWQFTCAFPFEGNWNKSPFLYLIKSPFKFTCAFPFEGNWNFCSLRSSRAISWICSHVPSRLKGIETPLQLLQGKQVYKGSHVPSRLKGIETALLQELAYRWLFRQQVHMCLPVWREWGMAVSSRQSVEEVLCSLNSTFWRLKAESRWRIHPCLPVWRECNSRRFSVFGFQLKSFYYQSTSTDDW